MASDQDWKNQLYFGDNLNILRDYIDDESVDLVYLDPPFNSKATYNVLFDEKDGTQSAAQIETFNDFWVWDQKSEDTFWEVVEKTGGERLSKLLQALREFLGENDMLAYLVMLSARLVELHRVLEKTGSLYLHCDSVAAAYIKLILDAIFGPKNFRNEIIWRRIGSHNSAKRFAPIHQVIFFYSKSNKYYFRRNTRPYMNGHVDQYFIKDEMGTRTNYYGNVLTGSGIRHGDSGKEWKGFDPTAKNRHWAVPSAIADDLDNVEVMTVQEKLDALYERGDIKIVEGQAWPMYERYISEEDGQFISDLWAYQPYTEGTVYGTDQGVDQDVRWLSPKDKERLGYQTQKPEGLLERIIKASSREGDVILDPFSGCGTTINVAERLHRKWIGIDVTHLAITVMKRRLADTFGPDLSDYEVIGVPTDEAGAEALALQDRFQFQWWALDLVEGRPVEGEKKKGADRGIDGVLFFHDDASGQAKKIIISVKSGKVQSKDLRDLKGTIGREKAAIGVLITLQKPTKHMLDEVHSAGTYSPPLHPDQRFPMIQILTIEDLLTGKGIDYPSASLGHRTTFKKATRKKKESEPEQRSLLDE